MVFRWKFGFVFTVDAHLESCFAHDPNDSVFLLVIFLKKSAAF